VFDDPHGGYVDLRDTIETLVASEAFEQLLLARERPIVAHAGTGEDFVVAGLATALDATVLAVTPGPREADALVADLEAFLGAERVALLPAWEALPYEGISPAPEVAARRAAAIARLREAKGAFVLVTPVLAAMQGVIPTLGVTPSIQLVAGLELPPDALAERLVELGYARSDIVEHRGEFAVRGGVLDVFPGTARRPVRLDYWGEEIESIREFVPSTQLSTDRVAIAEVPATRELIPDETLRDRAGTAAASAPERFADQLQRLADGLFVEGAETLAPFLFDRMPTPAELVSDGGWVVLTQAHRSADRARAAHLEAEALADAIAWPAARVLHPLDEALGDHVQLHLTEFAEGSISASRAGARRRATPRSSPLAPGSSMDPASAWCSRAGGTARSSELARCSATTCASTRSSHRSPTASSSLPAGSP
jgi:transcription-repair coupling factor (superfamily II helicase)